MALPMNGILTQLWVQSLAALVLAHLGPRDWGQVRDVVVALQTKNLTDLQKRAFAVDQLRDRGLTVSDPVLNLAIDAADIWASSRNGKKN